MSPRATHPWREWLLLLLAAGLAAGCGGGADPYGLGETVPVAGTITVNGKPLRLGQGAFGRVWFHPDTSRGNRCPQVPSGVIDAQGGYTLTTREVPGAPPGWYRVMLVATEPVDPRQPSRKRSLIHARYTAVETSGLAVQVVAKAAPGAYDLKLKR